MENKTGIDFDFKNLQDEKLIESIIISNKKLLINFEGDEVVIDFASPEKFMETFDLESNIFDDNAILYQAFFKENVDATSATFDDWMNMLVDSIYTNTNLELIKILSKEIFNSWEGKGNTFEVY